MKYQFAALVLAAGIFSTAASAEESDKLRIKELEEKMAALEREKAKLTSGGETASPAGQGLLDKDGKVRPGLSNAVLIIEGDKSVGTGFVVATGGKKYVYTAAHVFSGNSKLTIRNSAGTSFKKFGDLEAAEGADLVRMEILEEAKDALELFPYEGILQINTPISALGNGGGNGVVSVEPGKVLGTSADSLEVDAGIIQGNSGGPVVETSSGRVVGLATHLTNAREDVWSEGTRQGKVRRFACRLNKEWTWKTMKIGTFLTDARAVSDYDQLTRLCYALVQLRPLTSGMRLDTREGESAAALEIIQQNNDNDLVKSLIRMNNELGSRKGTMSETDLKKKFRSLLSQAQSQATRSNDTFKPQGFSWFHRTQAEGGAKARQECMEALRQNIDALK